MEEFKIILKREVQEIILEASIPVDQETITKWLKKLFAVRYVHVRLWRIWLLDDRKYG